ncbi:MAG: helix-turn-helix domain-containing protein, partial [Polyangiaceae bacterium]|nr:helix-turn-helix domain-containing protein [Polyangiaceae bacterium]
VAEFVGGLRGGFGARATPLRIHFRHAAPGDPQRVHAAHFGAPIVWGSTRDGADLDPALLGARPSGENAALSRYFMGILERRADLHAAYADRVRALLLEGLPSGPPTSARIARDLGMSERSLRRALAAEGTTYRKVLDELRRDAALELLEQKRTATDTSFLLGFSETSALSRAFRRWYGTSMRQRARGKKAP